MCKNLDLSLNGSDFNTDNGGKFYFTIRKKAGKLLYKVERASDNKILLEG